MLLSKREVKMDIGQVLFLSVLFFYGPEEVEGHKNARDNKASIQLS